MSPRSWVQVPLWIHAHLAQLVERKTFNLVVVGSSPTVGIRRMAQWLACVAHNHEVGCSIHPSPIFPNSTDINYEVTVVKFLGIAANGFN